MTESGARPSVRRAIEARRARGGRALIPFLTAGYPGWDLFDAAVCALAESGADALELGIPFSDPLADGPSIQAASQKALEAGVNVAEIFERIEARREAWRIPIVLMTYANPLLACGAERFATRAREAGVAGILITDLPPEELPEVWSSLAREQVETVSLVAPTTDPERIPLLTAAASGYIYCITRTGVTGRGGAYASNLEEQVARVRSHTRVPVVAGFGIRTPEDARGLGSFLDGVVVGARLIELLSGPSPEQALNSVKELAGGLRRALDPPR